MTVVKGGEATGLFSGLLQTKALLVSRGPAASAGQGLSHPLTLPAWNAG